MEQERGPWDTPPPKVTAPGTGVPGTPLGNIPELSYFGLLPNPHPRPLVLTSHPKLCGSLERENEHGQLSCFSLTGSPGEAGSF